jgi:hypothetical protein
MMTAEALEEYGIASADCREQGHIPGCPGAAGGDHETPHPLHPTDEPVEGCEDCERGPS